MSSEFGYICSFWENCKIMILVHTRAELGEVLDAQRLSGKSVGFVPTMGALHEGHLSLVHAAEKRTSFVVVSIFVNPTQFNDPADLERYPRTLSSDVALLEKTSCGVVFAPSVSEVYPEPDARIFDFGMLDKVMEGAHRPGHFNGVAQVVSRLFDMVRPDQAFFGEKDFQQLAIIREMVRQLHLPIEIVGCPIIREESGLALSSRNTLLTPGQRRSASLISRVLFSMQEKASGMASFSELLASAQAEIDKDPLLKTEYLEIVDAETLQSVSGWDHASGLRACAAVKVGAIRLIDNVCIKAS